MRAGLEAEGTRGQWGLGSFPSITFGARSCLEAWRQILTILQLAVGPWTNQVKWELKTRAFESVLSDVKEWEGWTHTTTWMDFRTVTECERSQPPKSMWSRSPFLRRSRTGKTNRWWNKDENHGCLWGRAGMDGWTGRGRGLREPSGWWQWSEPGQGSDSHRTMHLSKLGKWYT